MSSKAGFLVAVLCVLQAVVAEQKEVVFELASSNFEESTSRGLWMVKFYAPRCVHCQRLAPIFEQAAALLQDRVNFAKVDCTAHSGICSRFKVRGYPTVIFMDGEFQQVYRGERSADKIVSYIDSMTRAPVQNIQNEALLAQLRNQDVTSFVFVGADVSEFKKVIYERIATENRGSASFFISDDTILVQKFVEEEAADVLLAFRGDVDPFVYEGQWTKTSVQKWVEVNLYPILPELSAYNYERITNEPSKYAAILVIDPTKRDANSKLVSTMLAIARSENGKGDSSVFNFGWVDYNKWTHFANNIGFKPSNIPGLSVYQHSQIYYPNPEDFQHTFHSIQQYLQDVSSGKISATGEGTAWSNRISKIAQRFGSYVETNLEERPMFMLGILSVPAIILFIWLISFSSDEEQTQQQKNLAPSEHAKKD